MSDEQTDREGETKRFTGHLIIDWNDETMRHRKTAPDDSLGPTELAIPVSVDITVPEIQVPSIEAAIKVPATQVEQSVVEETRAIARERGVLDDE